MSTLLQSRYSLLTTNHLWLVVILCAFTVSGCTVRKPFYNKKQGEYQTSAKDQEGASHVVYLIGDAGAPDLVNEDETLATLKANLDQANQKKTAVVFL
jgi:hypothetical protein